MSTQPCPHPVTPAVPRRFERLGRLVGVAAYRRLAHSHVAVFGLGGVGSYAVEGLVRSGVGRLTLVDFDLVCATNTNRQLHAMPATVGQSKAELMAERCRLINPEATVEPYTARYEPGTGEAFLHGRPDFVVDAIDNVTAKIHLLHTCRTLGIPVVSSMGAGGRLDPTRVQVSDLADTRDDALARVIRKLLRRRYELPRQGKLGIHAIWSDEPRLEPREVEAPECGVECTCPQQGRTTPAYFGREKRVDGTAAFITSVFGMTAASVVVRHLAREGEVSDT